MDPRYASSAYYTPQSSTRYTQKQQPQYSYDARPSNYWPREVEDALEIVHGRSGSSGDSECHDPAGFHYGYHDSGQYALEPFNATELYVDTYAASASSTSSLPYSQSYETHYPQPGGIVGEPRDFRTPETASYSESEGIKDDEPIELPTPASIFRSKQKGEPLKFVRGVADKRWPCSLCEKSFDRPSTLTKHYLVHTGEKPHVCDTCGRRFGFPSNLTRHRKKCAPSLTAQSSSFGGSMDESPSPTSVYSTSSTLAGALGTPITPTIAPLPAAHSTKRRRLSSATTVTAGVPAAKRVKRARRAPAASKWLPHSLKGFTMEVGSTCSMPLAPVCPRSGVEERNSYDESFGSNELLYHASGWKGRLPGPAVVETLVGLEHKDVSNFGFIFETVVF